MPQESAKSPIFVICCSRSGSTLLRYVLDSHPNIGCPPELHLGNLCEQLHRTYSLIHGVSQSATDPATDATRSLMLNKSRQTIESMMAEYLAASGKSRWCDKSISTVDHLSHVLKVFPDAKFICLYRNCMDMVQSGLEVSRHSFSGYGFTGFVLKRLDNTVAAIMDYWCDKAQKMLAFEELGRANVHRLRYEDLVFNPTQVVPKLLEFLGVEPDPGLIDRIFSVPHQGGPGDSNIVFTRRIEQGSVGKGSTISRRQIPSEQLTRANGLLERLGYPIITDDWDSEPSPYVQSGRSGTVDAAQDQMTACPEEALTKLCALMGSLRERGTIKFVLDEGEGEAWQIVLNDGTAEVVRSHADAVADCEIRLALPLLHAVGQGLANPMKLLRSGELRISGNGDLARRAFQV